MNIFYKDDFLPMESDTKTLLTLMIFKVKTHDIS